MIQYYAVTCPPKYTLKKPMGLVRVTNLNGHAQAERVSKSGEWIEDRSLMADIWGIGGASGARKISKEEARDILEGWSFIENPSELLATSTAAPA